MEADVKDTLTDGTRHKWVSEAGAERRDAFRGGA